MKIVYENHVGEQINLSGPDYKMLRSTNLLDYEWSYETVNEYKPKVLSFNRKLVKKEFSVYISAGSRKKYNTLCNQLLEALEKDIYAVKPGRIIVNGNYYLPCYVVSKAIKSWFPYANAILNSFEIVSENGKWLKDVYRSFGAQFIYEPETEDMDYPYDYSFDYVPSGQINRLVSDSFVPFDFEIEFQGPATNPTVIVGGQIYRVYTTIEAGEMLVVNSLEKTIKKIKNNGDTVNEFSKRDRNNYIFEKMPATSGSTYVQYTPGTVVAIRAFTERSEPKWT